MTLLHSWWTTYSFTAGSVVPPEDCKGLSRATSTLLIGAVGQLKIHEGTLQAAQTAPVWVVGGCFCEW